MNPICDGKCVICDETELPNIKDKDYPSIGYSYAYKTDCEGKRYIEVDEVRELLKAERSKTIDEFEKAIRESNKGHWRTIHYEHGESVCETMSYDIGVIKNIAEQLKEG